MSGISVKNPPRADHRLIRRLLEGTFGGKVEHIPEEYDLVGRVFVRAGGSWRRIFMGSPVDLSLLKKVISLAIKKGHMAKKNKWS